LRRAFEDSILMTACTGDIHMRTCQFESGEVVIKGGAPPCGCVVARGAICPELTIVFVVAAMTRIAVLRRAFEDSILVTGCAGHIDV
jgi:hypothetical protein